MTKISEELVDRMLTTSGKLFLEKRNALTKLPPSEFLKGKIEGYDEILAEFWALLPNGESIPKKTFSQIQQESGAL